MIFYVSYLPKEYQEEVRELISNALKETAKTIPIDYNLLLEEAMKSKLSDLVHILGIEKVNEYRRIIASNLTR